MTIDIRVERNTRSLNALLELLRKVVREPGAYIGEEGILKAIISQGALAKYSNSELGIESASLNTHKRIADGVIDGGYGAVDRLRLAALGAFKAHEEKHESSNKVTKAGLLKRVTELESQCQILRQDLLLLTQALESSLAQGHNYAKSARNPTIVALCEREQRAILDMLSLLKEGTPVVRRRGVNSE